MIKTIIAIKWSFDNPISFLLEDRTTIDLDNLILNINMGSCEYKINIENKEIIFSIEDGKLVKPTNEQLKTVNKF